MARISVFFLIALIMFATANPLAHGILGLDGLLGGLGGLLGGPGGGLLGGLGGSPGGGLLGGLGGSPGGGLLGGSLLGRGSFVQGISNPTTVSPVLSATVSPLVRGVNITGRLCCTPTGNCGAAGGPPPLPRALVTINWSNQIGSGSLVGGPVPTNIDGFFNISVGNELGAYGSIPQAIPCNITVNVSQVVCPVLSGAGSAVLAGVLVPVGVVMDAIGGLILILQVSFSVGS